MRTVKHSSWSPDLDARLVQYPNFPTLELLDPVFNRTIPESSIPRLTEDSKTGVYKELALFELFLMDNSSNSRDRQVIRHFVCLLIEEALFRITYLQPTFYRNWFF